MIGLLIGISLGPRHNINLARGPGLVPSPNFGLSLGLSLGLGLRPKSFHKFCPVQKHNFCEKLNTITNKS